jgi:hypothetical protein
MGVGEDLAEVGWLQKLTVVKEIVCGGVCKT